MTKEEVKEWLKAIEEKYIHGGDEGFDAKRKEAISMAIKALEQEPITIYEIPKDYKYDTETEDFLVYRHKYTGDEIHIERPIPLYRLEQEPCEDAISRKQAIRKLQKKIDKKAKGDISGFYNTIVQNDIETIKELPSVQPKQRWIPVSERLPKDDERILVTRRMFHWANEPVEYAVGIESFSGNVDFVAWMPLPKPYKAETE